MQPPSVLSSRCPEEKRLVQSDQYGCSEVLLVYPVQSEKVPSVYATTLVAVQKLMENDYY